MKKLAFPMTALALLISGTASAAGPTNWTGFHAGIGIGANSTNVKQSTDAYTEYCSGPCTYLNGGDSDSFGKTKAIGTVEAGYDFQTGWGVVGLVANYDFGKKAEFSHSALASGYDQSYGESFTGDFEHAVSVDKSWALGGRLGALVSDKTLIYATGGYTRAKVSQSAYIAGCDWYCTDYSSSQSKAVGGYFIGAGVETILSGPFSAKLEYRYADYGKVKNNNGHPYSIDGNYGDISQSAEATQHSVRAVLSYRFQ